MEIIVGKTAGFCFGVKNAVNQTMEELESKGEIYCLGELVHNDQVINELKAKGAKIIDNIEEGKEKVIIRAHGVPENTYEKAKKLNIKLKDLTCPRVLYIHNIAENYRNNNYFIFLIGQVTHPETIGTISFCGENAIIIEKIEDVTKAIEKYKNSNIKNALVIAQTTFSMEKFKDITKALKKEIKNIKIKNTICNATKERQEETEEISKKVDTMIIIGGKNSSNSNKLYELATKHCKNVLFIESKDDLEINKINKNDTIGIIAGASTPQKSIDEVVDILKKMC